MLIRFTQKKMNIREVERTLIAKPVASRPTISDFRPFSELIAGATNGSPSSEPTVTAIRPKTVRFKPVMSSPPVEMVSSPEVGTRTQSCHLSNKILKSNHTSPLLYKPLAKTVSKAAISLLANMDTFNASHEQALAQNLTSQSEMVKGTDLPKLTPVESVNDKRPRLCTNNCDGYDGYNWRKYGQKKVKGSEYPRSYYRCTHADCMVRKKVERSINGKIAEIVYNGEHNHSKQRVARRHAYDGTSENLNRQFPNNLHNHDDEGVGSSSPLTDFVKVNGSDNHASSAAFDHDAPTSKRRRSLNQSNETHGEGLQQQPQVAVHDATDSEATSDGYRWRKYWQKVVKGNPYPRSYYRCTGVNCDVRKHVERASDDPTVFITTYEGKTVTPTSLGGSPEFEKLLDSIQNIF